MLTQEPLDRYLDKLDEEEKIQRRQELINMIEHRSGLDNKTRFEDYPELNEELIKIDAELYPEEEDLSGDIVPSWMYEDYREKRIMEEG